MAIKRKALVKSESELFKRSRAGASKKVELEEKDATMEEAEDEVEEEAVEEEEETESPEEVLARQEKETTAARTKELKGMYIDALKSLASSKGLDASKKDDIIKAVLSCEAAERAKAREHENKIRTVVANQKQELEGMSIPALKQMCSEKGIGGILSKQARVEQLLKHWQEDDGVDKALAKMAQDARATELGAMDNSKLQRLCEKAGVNPFVKEVVVDRVVRCEVAKGRFLPPVAPSEEEEHDQASSKGSMVDAIMANEVLRKKEKERKQKQEEAAANKIKELRAMSLDDLKKSLTKKGQEPVGKKDDLVQALYAIHLQDEAIAAKKAKMQAMGIDQLKTLAVKRGVQLDKKSEKKDKLIEALLDAEAKTREALRIHEGKVQEVAAEKKQELDGKTANELKELCVSKGLKPGLGKDERAQRLLDEARASGDLDQVVSVRNQGERTTELLATDMGALLKLSSEVGADPYVTDVMVERILAHELALGCTTTEPSAKKAKK